MLAIACFRAPENGTLSPDNSLTASRDFIGASTAGSTGGVNRSALVEFLRDAKNNPLDSASWGGFNRRFNLTSSALTFHGFTYYVWSASATLASLGVTSDASWPAGGAIAFRAKAPVLQNDGTVSPTDQQLPAFDDGADACLNSFPDTTPWQTIADKCVSKYPGGIARMLDTSHNPALPVDAAVITKQPRFLSFKKDRLAGLVQADDTATVDYYKRVGAARLPDTLAGFKTRYGFGAGDNAAGATYYNYGDLGLGREMKCRSFAASTTRNGVACYVTNFAGIEFNKPFGAYADNDATRTAALDHAVAHTTHPEIAANSRDVATVAMAWDPTFDEPVIFAAYNGANGSAFAAKSNLPTGKRLDKAVLDNEARLDPNHGNASIPSNCLNCHGGSAFVEGTGSAQKIKNAMFLPFDLENLRFQASGAFSRTTQEPQLAALNALVLTTVLPDSPTPNATLAATINGWYAPGTVLGGTFHDDYVPPGWKSTTTNQPWSDRLYSSVIQPYCQGCHVTQAPAAKDFMSLAGMIPFVNQAMGYACGPTPAGSNKTSVANTHLMPHAEMTMKHFWESPARAHLLGAFGALPFALGGTPTFSTGCGSTEANVAIR